MCVFSKSIESIIRPISRQPTYHHHHHLSSHNTRISKHPATGPTMSLQLTLPPPIETRRVSRVSTGGAAEVQLSQERSLCLVKIFLNASLGCICFARGLIPSDSPSYRDRRVYDLVLISLASTPASYHKFLSFQGQLSVNTESQLFKVLVGGKDKRADHILNLVVSRFSHRRWRMLKGRSPRLSTECKKRSATAKSGPACGYQDFQLTDIFVGEWSLRSC